MSSTDQQFLDMVGSFHHYLQRPKLTWGCLHSWPQCRRMLPVTAAASPTTLSSTPITSHPRLEMFSSPQLGFQSRCARPVPSPPTSSLAPRPHLNPSTRRRSPGSRGIERLSQSASHSQE